MVGTISKHYMRAHIMSGTDAESWQWQLPDISEGQTISFCMVDAKPGSGVPPHFIRPIDPAEVSEDKRRSSLRKGYERAAKCGRENEAVSPFVQVAATKDGPLIALLQVNELLEPTPQAGPSRLRGGEHSLRCFR